MKFKRPTKRLVIYALAATIVVGLVIVGVILLRSNPDEPSYSTVKPANTSISDLGGWKRVSPVDSNPVFAYSDTLDSVSISVSQQPLPPSFKDNESTKVAELAQSYNASNKLDAHGTAVYIGDSAKGPQSVIFTKDGLLILIKSQQKVSNESWIRYINSLN